MFKRKKKVDFENVMLVIKAIIKDLDIDDESKLSIIKTYIECLIES